MKPNEDMHEICSCDNGQSFYECSIFRMRYNTIHWFDWWWTRWFFFMSNECCMQIYFIKYSNFIKQPYVENVKKRIDLDWWARRREGCVQDVCWWWFCFFFFFVLYVDLQSQIFWFRVDRWSWEETSLEKRKRWKWQNGICFFLSSFCFISNSSLCLRGVVASNLSCETTVLGTLSTQAVGSQSTQVYTLSY